MWTNFGINQDLFKKKASINLSVSQPWQEKRRYFSEKRTEDFYSTNGNFYVQRSMRIGFSYRFGKMDLDITKKKRGIDNDDIKSGGGGSGGGN